MTASAFVLGVLAAANLAAAAGIGLALLQVRRKLDCACWELVRLRRAAEQAGAAPSPAGHSIPAAVETARCGSGPIGPGLVPAEA